MTANSVRSALLALPLLLLPALPAGANQSGVLGHWLTENGKAIIEIVSCGERLCGRIAWLRKQRDISGRLKTDANNPDPGARARPLCGLRLIDSLAPSGGQSFGDGRIYNAKNGKTYGLEVNLVDRDTLEVRGYYGISLLGRTQSWQRAESDRGGCTMRFETAGPVGSN
ncbi:MAG: DUF2147 domain-containing protein [Pseudomonadota bacterium]